MFGRKLFRGVVGAVAEEEGGFVWRETARDEVADDGEASGTGGAENEVKHGIREERVKGVRGLILRLDLGLVEAEGLALSGVAHVVVE